jgi:hypothetical protein
MKRKEKSKAAGNRHGGRRPGSGRRPLFPVPARAISLTLPLSLIDTLDERAEDKGVTRSQIVAALLASLDTGGAHCNLKRATPAYNRRSGD